MVTILGDQDVTFIVAILKPCWVLSSLIVFAFIFCCGSIRTGCLYRWLLQEGRYVHPRPGALRPLMGATSVDLSLPYVSSPLCDMAAYTHASSMQIRIVHPVDPLVHGSSCRSCDPDRFLAAPIYIYVYYLPLPIGAFSHLDLKKEIYIYMCQI